MLEILFLNYENKLFKPFKKGDLLLNNIITYDESQNKKFVIFSTSKSINSKQCTLTIDLSKTNSNDLSKLENLLKSHTWNLSKTLKTSENGVSYTLRTLLNKHNINISYKTSITPHDIKPIKPVVNKILFDNLPKQLSFFD